MHIWDYHPDKLAKNPDFEKIRLERLINYGLDQEKVDRKVLEKHLEHLKIPEDTRKFLKFII